MRDLAGLQTRHLAQRQCDLSFRAQRRMTAREDEAEPLVWDRAHVVLLLGAELFETREQLGLARERSFTPDPVDRTVARRCHDPRPGVPRHAVLRPALERLREGVLHCVLGKLEVTEDADENRDGTSPLLPEDGLDRY